jgi:hypothetical protein
MVRVTKMPGRWRLFPKRVQSGNRVFVHSFRIFYTGKAGGPRSATETCPTDDRRSQQYRQKAPPRRPVRSASTRFISRKIHGASPDEATIFSVALRGSRSSSVLKNPWPNTHSGSERPDTRQPSNDRAQCPEQDSMNTTQRNNQLRHFRDTDVPLQPRALRRCPTATESIVAPFSRQWPYPGQAEVAP